MSKRRWRRRSARLPIISLAAARRSPASARFSAWGRIWRIPARTAATGAYTLWLVPLTFIGTVILIVLCQMVWVGGVQPGGVVLCILLFNTPVESYVSYALYRILDTTIGVLVAWAVSYVFPRGWMQLWQERIEALKAR